jgi:DNA mismatch repair ATPase MutS
LLGARFALDYGGMMPTIVDDPELEFTNVAHPVLMIQPRGARPSVIPSARDLTQRREGCWISGPNAGGKTVAMKTIAISMVMAYSGIFPLGMCTLSPRRVTTAIGDHQSIESNLVDLFIRQDPFACHILSHCDATAMVFVDEILVLALILLKAVRLRQESSTRSLNVEQHFVVTTHQSSRT